MILVILKTMDAGNIHILSVMAQYMNLQAYQNFLILLIDPKLKILQILEESLRACYWGGCAPRSSERNKISQQKNRPFLTRLVGDPIGKEADRETIIGEQQNVTKYIN